MCGVLNGNVIYLLTLEGGTNTPYFGLHWKYLTPSTEPSFFPWEWSSSTPNQKLSRKRKKKKHVLDHLHVPSKKQSPPTLPSLIASPIALSPCSFPVFPRPSSLPTTFSNTHSLPRSKFDSASEPDHTCSTSCHHNSIPHLRTDKENSNKQHSNTIGTLEGINYGNL